MKKTPLKRDELSENFELSTQVLRFSRMQKKQKLKIRNSFDKIMYGNGDKDSKDKNFFPLHGVREGVTVKAPARRPQNF